MRCNAHESTSIFWVIVTLPKENMIVGLEVDIGFVRFQCWLDIFQCWSDIIRFSLGILKSKTLNFRYISAQYTKLLPIYSTIRKWISLGLIWMKQKTKMQNNTIWYNNPNRNAAEINNDLTFIVKH